MKFQIALLVGLACSALATPIIQQQVLKEIDDKGTTNVIISFKKSNVAGARNTFINLRSTLSTRAAKLNTFYNIMKDHADTVQHKVRTFLEKAKTTKNFRISQSWVTGELIVRGIDKATVLALQKMEDIKEVKADRLIPWIERGQPIYQTGAIVPLAQWGVDKVRAQAVWDAPNGTNGTGCIVGTIDTGVRGTHEALRNNHREEYGWLDPAEGDEKPTDNDGHGTHTMGTICGQTNGVGVAPGARWIACKGCGFFGCYLSDLTDCGNFMTCPTKPGETNPRCDLAPNLVSNSWGGGQGDAFYDEVIAAWKLVHIAPLFSIGNSGNGCGTANSPGDSIDAIGVGSTASDDTLSSFSSRGPTYRGQRIKPDISAPGSAVVSSYNDDDTSYATLSGTSMACPHIAGIAALAYSRNPDLTYDQIKEVLTRGAQKDIKSGGQNCGGVPETEHPNHHVGHGRADALATFEEVGRL